MFSMITPNMLCPKCFRNGNLSDICPDCGTETFPAGRNMRFPRKSAKRKWKRLLKSTDPYLTYVVALVAEYNANPYKNWYTQRHVAKDTKKTRETRQRRCRRLQKQKRERLMVKVFRLVTINEENQISENLADPDQKPWFSVRIVGGGYCDTKALYSGKILRRAKTEFNRATLIYTTFADNKMKLSKNLKNRLAIEIKNWSNEMAK